MKRTPTHPPAWLREMALKRAEDASKEAEIDAAVASIPWTRPPDEEELEIARMVKEIERAWRLGYTWEA